MGGCRHYLKDRKFQVVKTEGVKAEMPMTFPIEGALVQTFQSRHFPEVRYEVKLKDGDLVCTCRGFNFHGSCKHTQFMKGRLNQGVVSL
jgi:hypothetical protein